MLDWRALYKTRLALDHRWTHDEPKVARLSGHADSVYCLEFDSTRIITGSRDRSIKVWSLLTGKLLATFRWHAGSVLCLKFDKDWDVGAAGGEEEDKVRPGFMVSGSSDCSICVWDLRVRKNGEVDADVRAVLRGHTGGVLDLRIDDQWIVSW
jgi:F-box and WD-40 domain protein 1/11